MPTVRPLMPLPLSDFEYYMLTDDRPSHPMVFVITVHLTGSLSEAPLREALDELLSAHPLLDSRIDKRPGQGWCWQILESPRNILEWKIAPSQSVADFVPTVRPIDILRERGIHVQVLAAADQAQVIMSLHHACCDGIAALQLIGELFARYGRKTASADAKKPEFESVNPETLLQRENYEIGDAAAQRQKKSLRRVVGKISRLLLRAPVILACSRDFDRIRGNVQGRTSTRQNNAPAIRSRVLPKSIHRSLRAVAARDDVSINDLFIREMILHIRDWNLRGGVRFGRRWIRLAVPLSMRTSRHDRMPAANVVSYALVTRREQDCADPAALLQSIRQQTSDVLFNREGIVCLKLFRVLRRIPGAMKMFLGFKSVLSTMVLANVGDVRRRFSGRFPLQHGRWVAGNVVIQQIHGVAPVRPNTRAAMSIGDYAGELSISLRTDSEVFDDQDSERFIDEFLQRLRTLAQQEADGNSAADV